MDRFAIENPTYVVTVSTGKCDKCIKIIAKCAFAFVITTFIVGVATVRWDILYFILSEVFLMQFANHITTR